MRFALLGNHPDGIDFVRALLETGRHELIGYSGPSAGMEPLRQRAPGLRPTGDLEELLADPAVEGVVVASKMTDRPNHLRRALQSERHVICAHPADATPDSAYEAAMIQGDTKQTLLPLLPEMLHPGVALLRELVRGRKLGKVGMIELERGDRAPVLWETDPLRQRAAVPGWEVLRLLGGEIAEVSAFAAGEEVTIDQPLLLTGKFENSALFRGTYQPDSAAPVWCVRVGGDEGQAELVFTRGWPGPARLTGPGGLDESWDAWDPWPPLVEAFEIAVGLRPAPAPSVPAAALVRPGPSDAITAERPRPAAHLPARAPAVTWQDEVRCLELDSAARRSVHYRRVSVMEYQEVSEEVGFKGTMTLVGCGLLWAVLVLLFLSVWQPMAGWLIGPVLGLFLVMQLLRWLIPGKPSSPNPPE